MYKTKNIPEFNCSVGGNSFGVAYTTACDRLEKVDGKRESEETERESVSTTSMRQEKMKPYKERAEQ
jgi:hypothetical protein